MKADEKAQKAAEKSVLWQPPPADSAGSAEWGRAR